MVKRVHIVANGYQCGWQAGHILATFPARYINKILAEYNKWLLSPEIRCSNCGKRLYIRDEKSIDKCKCK